MGFSKTETICGNTIEIDTCSVVTNKHNDSAETIRKAIKDASDMNTNTTVKLSEGIHHIRSTANDSPENTFHTLYFSDIHNVTIEGNNTTLMIDDPFMDVFYFSNSSNITIKGITIDYSIDPWVQGTVTAIDENSGNFILAVENVSADGKTILDDPRWIGLTTSRCHTSPFGMVRNDNNPLLLKSGVQSFFFGFTNPKKLAYGIYEIGLTKDTYKAWLNTHIQVGSKIVLLNRIDSVGAFRFKNCSGTISVENCNIYASVGTIFCIGAVEGNILINNVHTVIKPKSGRWLTSNADGMYIRNIKGSVTVTNSVFEGLSDDAINLYTTGCILKEVISEKQIKITGFPILIPKAGEKITVIDPVNGSVRGHATVLKSKTIGEINGRDENASAVLTLSNAIENLTSGTSYQDGDVVINQSAQAPKSLIENNIFRYGRAKGVKLNIRDGKICGNLFKDLGYAAINLHDIPILAENAGAYNLIIDNNTIENCSFLSWTGTDTTAPITISGMCVDYSVAKGHIHHNIDIKNNTISNVYKHGMYISSAECVTLDNNSIYGFDSDGTAKGMSGITIENADNVKIAHLTVNDPRPDLESGIRILKDCNEIIVKENTFQLANGVKSVTDYNYK